MTDSLLRPPATRREGVILVSAGDVLIALTLCLCLEAMLADDYAIREHGSRLACQLLATRPGQCQPIVIAAAHYPAPEVRTRCSRLVPRYRAHLAAVYVPNGVPCWPCIDMVPDSFPDRWGHVQRWRCAAMDSPRGRDGPPWWGSWRRATELWVRAEIAEGMSYAEADTMLSRMWSRELDYHAERYPDALPLVWDWQRRGWEGGYPD